MTGQDDIALTAFVMGMLQAFRGTTDDALAIRVRVRDATAELFRRHPETRAHLAGMSNSERVNACFQLAVQFLPQVKRLAPGEPFVFEM